MERRDRSDSIPFALSCIMFCVSSHITSGSSGSGRKRGRGQVFPIHAFSTMLYCALLELEKRGWSCVSPINYLCLKNKNRTLESASLTPEFGKC